MTPNVAAPEGRYEPYKKCYFTERPEVFASQVSKITADIANALQEYL